MGERINDSCQHWEDLETAGDMLSPDGDTELRQLLETALWHGARS